MLRPIPLSMKPSQKRYLESDKGREVSRQAQTKYNHTEAGQEARRRYSKTDKGKEASRRASKAYRDRKRAEKQQ